MTLSVCNESGNPKKISAITQSHIQEKPDSHKNADNQYGFLDKDNNVIMDFDKKLVGVFLKATINGADKQGRRLDKKENLSHDVVFVAPKNRLVGQFLMA